MSDLNVGFMNARSLTDRKKRVDVIAWLKNKSCNIVCLADTLSSGATEKWRQQTYLISQLILGSLLLIGLTILLYYIKLIKDTIAETLKHIL